jgi:hypothetical protein
MECWIVDFETVSITPGVDDREFDFPESWTKVDPPWRRPEGAPPKPPPTKVNLDEDDRAQKEESPMRKEDD